MRGSRTGWRRLREFVSRNRACLFLALANLAQHRLRLVVALTGTAVPIVLLVLQIAFLDAARVQVTRLYDYFAFDIVFLPQTYQFLIEGGSFDRVRLTQARAIPEVVETFSLNIDSTHWTAEATQTRSPLLLVGVDDPGNFIRAPGLRDSIAGLRSTRSVLVDAFSAEDFGPLQTGTTAAIAEQPVEIAGTFQLGLFFYADGSAIARNADFARLTRRDTRDTSIGLLRLAEGADAERVKEQLASLLPPDVRVLTRNELITQERAFFITTKPIGIMLSISMWIAFLVGAVILLQVISTEIVNRMTEFATLNAMGFDAGFVYGVGILEALLLGLGAFVPAFFIGALILWLVEAMTNLPAGVTPALAFSVLMIVLAMCTVSAGAAIRRIAHADPAELY